MTHRRRAGRKLDRRAGTDKGVQLRARLAYQQACRQAEEDDALGAAASLPPRETTLGLDRARLMHEVRQVALPDRGEQTQRYRKNTQLKTAAKLSVPGPWAGWQGGQPALRRGGALAVADSHSRAQAQALSSSAKRWMATAAARGQRAQKSGAPAPVKVKAVRGALTPVLAAMARPCTAEQTLEDLFVRRVTDPATADIVAWLRAIAAGGKVTCRGHTYAFLPAFRLHAQIILATDKHTSLARDLRSISTAKGSNWQIVDNSPQGLRASAPKQGLRASAPKSGKRFTIAKKRDFIPFLIEMRRPV